jgi:hypothetical protein
MFRRASISSATEFIQSRIHIYVQSSHVAVSSPPSILQAAQNFASVFHSLLRCTSDHPLISASRPSNSRFQMPDPQSALPERSAQLPFDRLLSVVPPFLLSEENSHADVAKTTSALILKFVIPRRRLNSGQPRFAIPIHKCLIFD